MPDIKKNLDEFRALPLQKRRSAADPEQDGAEYLAGLDAALDRGLVRSTVTEPSGHATSPGRFSGRMESIRLRFRYKRKLHLPRPSRGPATEINLTEARDPMSSVTTHLAPKGLEGIVATNSSICYIDGDRGVLAYRGIDIHELADHSNFEETCYLLWFGQSADSRRTARTAGASGRRAPAGSVDHQLAAQRSPDTPCPWMCCARRFRRCRFTIRTRRTTITRPMFAKRSALTSQIAMIVAAYDRIRKGQAGRRSRPLALACCQFSAAAERQASLRRPPSALSISL